MIKIPYLNTRIETDLVMTLVLAPLWWVTGLSAFIYYAAVLWIFIKFLLQAIRHFRVIFFPFVNNWFLLFLISSLASIIFNIPLRPSQRIFSSLNNWLMFAMGHLILLLVYNCEPTPFFKRLLKSCRFLCFLNGIMGLVILIAWFAGYKQIQAPTLLGRIWPSLMNYPYFYGLLNIRGTVPDWLMGGDILPRLTLYGLSATAVGGLMLMVLPLAHAYYIVERKKFFESFPVLILGLTVLVFSLSRSAIYAFVMAILLVYVLQKGFSFLLSVCFISGGLVASGAFSKFLEWIFNLRKFSTLGRFELSEEALRILLEENPLIGVGVRLREEFTFMAIGTHGGIYLEILFTAGVIGLFFFGIFHFLLLKNWWMQKRSIQNPAQKKIWAHLGVSLIGVHIWLLTDTIVAFPLIAYSYFLIAGSVLLLGKTVQSGEPNEFF